MLKKYENFQLTQVAERAQNYITSMVDEKYNFLPYWFVQINESPAYARHVRVDDAELVASWYEAAVCLERILGESANEMLFRVKKAFKEHLFKSWGEHGLRFHEEYPWSNITHSSFHEMGYVLSALNRILEEEPNNTEAKHRAQQLVKGMRELVLHRKIKTFWSGDFEFGEAIFEFPADIYIKDTGFVPERVTGRGEEAIRNGVVLQALVIMAERQNDEAALDLAVGIANYVLGLSRYFNWKGEFFGHVHSSLWFASGLARLGRLVQNERYIKKANQIFTYVKSLSSEYGWVPEYAQWKPLSEEFCETCCIKDMIECAFELIECGFDYWDLINKFTRNHLTEQQVKTGCFISSENKPDETGITWKNLDKRVVGGWSGGGEANSISLTKFRSIAGCCVGTAPQALFLVWDKIIQKKNNGIYINFPIDKQDELAKIETGYPNDGYLKITANCNNNFYIRPYDWMGQQIELKINGRFIPLIYSEMCLLFENIKTGDVIEIKHPLPLIKKEEAVRDGLYTVWWKGSDVVKIEPEGEHLRLYQRDLGAKKIYPAPANKKSSSVISLMPTEQK